MYSRSRTFLRKFREHGIPPKFCAQHTGPFGRNLSHDTTYLRPKVAIMLVRGRCAFSPFSVSILKNPTGPGSESPWSPFGRRLRPLCGSPWPDSHFGKVLHRVGEGSRLRLLSQGVPVDYGVPKNGGGSFSTGVASLWRPVRFLRRK
jgi:hypothetical protein